jgi:hypothetical protein
MTARGGIRNNLNITTLLAFDLRTSQAPAIYFATLTYEYTNYNPASNHLKLLRHLTLPVPSSRLKDLLPYRHALHLVAERSPVVRLKFCVLDSFLTPVLV